MSLRFFASLSALAAGIALLLAPADVAGQAPKAAKHPDLHGYWTNSTVTPLERPAELAAKEFFTEQEAIAYERQRIQRENSQSKEDIHYDNVLWQTEKYAKGLSNRRTSLPRDTTY